MTKYCSQLAGQFNSILHKKNLKLSPINIVTDTHSKDIVWHCMSITVYEVTDEISLETDDAVTKNLVLLFV